MSTIVKPRINIDENLGHQISEICSGNSQVIFICSFTGRFASDQIRIWKSTYLFPKESDSTCKLLYAENITFYPEWMPVPTGKTVKFILVFSGLPKSCKHFDLVEDIPEPGGFIYSNIKRNKTDVYRINLTA